ncbi:TatD family hydrolase [Acidobacteriota bacterium]
MTEPPCIIDVHTHLHADVFDEDRAEVMGRAREAGVKAILLMGEGPGDNDRVLDVAGADPFLYPCLGYHPDRLEGKGVEESLRLVQENLPDLAAVGEVGLDFWRAKTAEERERQVEIFRQFIRLAIEQDLPLSVHSRSAGKRTLQVLEEMGARRVCMHAFDGKAGYAADAVERLGYYFSIPPSIVRSRQKQKLAQRVPLSALLLETDSPVLGAEPGKRNEPANILLAAEKIAELKKVDVEEVLAAAWNNSKTLFTRLVIDP